MGRDFGFALYIAIFSAPFHWIGFFAPDSRWPFAVGAAMMDMIVLWLLSRGGRVLLMRRRYGAPMLRFRRFLEAVDRGEADLASLALDAGYADQAHLTREATRLAGATPLELVRSRGRS